MNADDFQELYKLLRGSKSAMPVLDAKTLYSEGKMDAALEKLVGARETFMESRSRLIKQDVEAQVDKKAKDRDRQVKKLKRKQEKLLDTVKVFDELIPQLEKQAERERQRAEKAAARAEAHEPSAAEVKTSTSEAASPTELPRQEVARTSDVSEDFAAAFTGTEGDERLDVVSKRFGFREVESDEDLCAESLYLIQSGSKSYLVATPSDDAMVETVAVTNVVDDRPIKPFSRKDFLQLGKRRKMVLLTRIDGQDYSVPPPAKPRPAQTPDSSSGSEPDAESESNESVVEQSILDMGAFSQLLMSAQRCGLVPGADQIGHVRDREFRKGKYDLAFQAIDSMFSKFTAAAGQRAQKLTREDADIASGRIKISPKDLQAKRTRDRAQTQEVDRAKRRFQVVLEGLRVLMNTQQTEDQAVGT